MDLATRRRAVRAAASDLLDQCREEVDEIRRTLRAVEELVKKDLWQDLGGR